MDDRPRRGRGSDALTTFAWCALLVACGSGSSVTSVGPGATGADGTRTSSSSTAATGATAAPTRALSAGGFVVRVPASWTVARRAVVGTALAHEGAECVSAEVLEGDPSSGGSVADLPRAAVQICVVPRGDGLDLRAWLAGRGITAVTRTRTGACDTLAPPASDDRRLTYAQSGDRRAEIATTITSPPSTAGLRRREVAAALSSMGCPSS